MNYSWTGEEAEEHDGDEVFLLRNKAKLLDDILAEYGKLKLFERGRIPASLMRLLERAKKAVCQDHNSVI